MTLAMYNFSMNKNEEQETQIKDDIIKWIRLVHTISHTYDNIKD